jgi:plastocyanin
MFLLAAAACGGGGTGDDDAADIDANPPAGDVVEVSCNGATIAQTITTAGLAYSPETATIAVGEIVRFSPTTGHDVNNADFHVDFAGDACFRFDVAETYTFDCSVHGFTGTLTVE